MTYDTSTKLKNRSVCPEDLFIELLDGSKWYPGRDDNDIAPQVIAGSTAKLCRYTGHSSGFYSVAEHSVKISYLLGYMRCPELAFEALVHDAHECITNDLSKPFKVYVGGTYEKAEDKIEMEVRKLFGLPYGMHDAVHHADQLMRFIEAYDLMPSRGECHFDKEKYQAEAMEYASNYPYLKPHCWDWETAEQEWLQRFAQLVVAKYSTGE